jgi:aminomethyltransferase
VDGEDEKPDFMGKAAMTAKAPDSGAASSAAASSRRASRHGWEVLQDGAVVGHVPAASSPTLKQSIAMAYVPAAGIAEGTEYVVRSGATELPARVVPRPFYTEASHR